MEVQCGFKAAYSETLKDIITRNWLINPSCKPGKWYPLDQYQEMLMYHLKQLDAPDSSHNLKEYHRKCLAPLVIFLLEFKKEMREGALDAKWEGNHTKRSKSIDIRHLIDKMRRERVFQFRPDREAVDGKEAKDWFHLGQIELQERRYWDSFLNRSLRTSNGQENVEDVQEHVFDFAD
jgi:hypothetical protein